MNEIQLRNVSQILDYIDSYIPELDDGAEREWLVQQVFAEYINHLNDMTTGDWLSSEGDIQELLESKGSYARVYLYSRLLSITGNPVYTDRILNEVMVGSLRLNEKHFVYTQMKCLVFQKPDFKTADSEDLFRKVYQDILKEYRSRLRIPDRIPIEERNRGFVLVMTGQVLEIQHAPTKVALNHCQVLIRALGKEVLLINLADTMSFTGVIPLHDIFMGNYVEAYSSEDYITYKNVSIPFVQMDRGLPTVEGIQGLLDLIMEYRPYQILLIGGGSVTMDICSLVSSSLLIPLSADMAVTYADYQARGEDRNPVKSTDVMLRKPLITDIDREVLSEIGKTESHLIPVRLNYAIDEQTHTYRRSDRGLPEGRTIGVVVGGRLDEEVGDDFLQMLDKAVSEGLYVTFVGGFDKGVRRITESAYPALHANYTFVGYEDDLMALYDLVDLYINPYRAGGGTSAIEALYKGVPVLTCRYGDIYDAVGDDFAVGAIGKKDYDEMEERIRLYLTDEKYYREQSEKARETAKEKVDNDQVIVDMMREFERRMTDGSIYEL